MSWDLSAGHIPSRQSGKLFFLLERHELTSRDIGHFPPLCPGPSAPHSSNPPSTRPDSPTNTIPRQSPPMQAPRTFVPNNPSGLGQPDFPPGFSGHPLSRPPVQGFEPRLVLRLTNSVVPYLCLWPCRTLIPGRTIQCQLVGTRCRYLHHIPMGVSFEHRPMDLPWIDPYRLSSSHPVVNPALSFRL
jgi:hypothetical protein